MKLTIEYWRVVVPTILAALVFVGTDRSALGAGCASCLSGCQPYQTVERTIYVPQIVRETRTVNQIICEPEVRERVVTVCRQVPETREVTEHYTVMVPVQRTAIQNYVVQKPVWNEVEQSYTVWIPHTEAHTGVRNVCRPVHVQQLRTVTRNMCVWEEIPCDGSCGGYGESVQKGDSAVVQKSGANIVQKGTACGGKHRVLRTRCVTQEIPVTVCKIETHQQEYTYHVTTCHPETRTRMVRVCNYVCEPKSREVTYTVCVPEQRTRTCQVTSYRTVTEEQTERYTVMVPRTVQREVTVPVCRMVPRQVTCRVPVTAPCAGCGHHF